MKKVILVCAIVSFLYLNNKATEEIIIPNDAIRIRVIANSAPLLKDAKTKEEVRQILVENVSNFSITVENRIQKTPYSGMYQVNYGMNYFPEKRFKGVTYEEGYYESLVVTLGEGKGDNWWCVLFPPLCLTETEEENMEEVEYRSFIKDVLDHFFA